MAWSLGGAVGKMGAQLAVQIVLARLLDPLVFGQYTAVFVVVGLAYILADAGFGSALVQKKTLLSQDVGLALGWSLLFGATLAALIAVGSPFLANQFEDATLAPVFAVCALWVPLMALSNISSSLLRRDFLWKEIQVISLAGYTVFYGGIAIVGAVRGWGVWSLVAGFSAQVLFTVYATYRVSRHTLRPRLRGDPALIRFGLKSLATDSASWSMDNLDRLLVGKFWGLQPLGLYSVAYNLSKAPTGVLISAGQGVAFAGAARLQEDIAYLRDKFGLALTAVAFLTLPSFMLVAVESSAVLQLVYGTKWLAAAPYMTALALAIPWIALGMLTGGVLRGLGHVGPQMRIQLMATALLVGGLVALSGFPLRVAVWVVPCAYLARFAALALVLCRHIAMPRREVVAAVAGAVLLGFVGMAAACWARARLGVAGLWPFLIGGGCMVVVLAVFGRRLLGERLTVAVQTRVLTWFGKPR